jgi:opacity protein-like surface antigen
VKKNAWLLSAIIFATHSICPTNLRAEAVQVMTDQEIKDKAFEKYQGFNFGAGLGVMAIPSNRLARNGAQVVNGAVRINDQSNVTASVVLESHYFFSDKTRPRFGHGPFVAIKAGGDQVIDTIGLGYMMGWRYDEKANSSWNLGAGLTISPSAKVLADGISKNAPLPAGETEARLQQKSLWGFMVLVSFSYNTFEMSTTK